MELNALYFGDCLDWMERWNDSSVDLIYLDPPFNSNVNYNILYSTEGGGQAQYRAFTDTWRWDSAAADRLEKYKGATGLPAHNAIVGLHHILGKSGMLAYLTYMAERLEHMRRLLRPTGSIYLHCDPTMSHYLKVVMDAIFGAENFRNEIVWAYKSTSQARRWFPRKHDTILFYAKSSHATFNSDAVRVPYKESRMPHRINDPAHNRGGSGKWPGESRKTLDERTQKGKVPEDWWEMTFGPNNPERLGYPTQKPRDLLERIIKASSNVGDIVLDPFCGCGTTIDAARRLNRRWIGIDISSFAIDLIKEQRLQDSTIPTHGIPYDLVSARKLAREKPFDFETWAINRLPGFVPNDRQVADGGVDGYATLAIQPEDRDSKVALAQVKGGRFSLSALRDFAFVMERDSASAGCYITLDRVETAEARSVAAGAGKVRVSGREYRRMHLWPIRDYFDEILPQLPMMTNPYTGKPLNLLKLF